MSNYQSDTSPEQKPSPLQSFTLPQQSFNGDFNSKVRDVEAGDIIRGNDGSVTIQSDDIIPQDVADSLDSSRDENGPSSASSSNGNLFQFNLKDKRDLEGSADSAPCQLKTSSQYGTSNLHRPVFSRLVTETSPSEREKENPDGSKVSENHAAAEKTSNRNQRASSKVVNALID